MEASAKVLGIPEFDEDIFFDKVESITVQGTHELLFACMTAQRSSSTGCIRLRRHHGHRNGKPETLQIVLLLRQRQKVFPT